MSDESKVSERTVKIRGIEHTMMLDDDEAKKYEAAEESFQATQAESGDAGGEKAEQAPANKSRTAKDK